MSLETTSISTDRIVVKLDKYLWMILEEVNRRIRLIKESANWSRLTTKLKSEFISNLVGTVMSEMITDCYSPQLDSEPDLIMYGEPLELKTSHKTRIWQSGRFSKRGQNFLLISWEEVKEDIRWFVCFTKILMSDWEVPDCDSYYGTKVDLDFVLEKDQTTILRGTTMKKRKLTYTVMQ